MTMTSQRNGAMLDAYKIQTNEHASWEKDLRLVMPQLIFKI